MDPSVMEAEAAFADAEYAPHASELGIAPWMLSTYGKPRRMWDWRQRSARLLGNLSGCSLLDYGCGMGEEAVTFAYLGARVTAIDISQVGIQICRERAVHNGLSERLTSLVMSGDCLEFPDESFDLVHGLGILHHVGLAAGLREVWRVLKPGGTAVFLEPLGDCAWVERWKRRLHQGFRDRFKLIDVTEEEQNLRFAELHAECSRFHYFRLCPYHLTYRVRKLLFPRFLHKSLKVFDYFLLSCMPFLQTYAGAVVIHLRK